MAKIAFILLCHKNPAGVIQQAEQLTATGDCIAIHYDARASEADYRRITEALADNPGVVFARTRVRCGWGAWSLVQATLNAIEAALEAFEDTTHLYMVSGDCMAIKSARYAKGVLDGHDADYIESVDFFESGWIKTGLKEERLIYRHFFNERESKGLFYASMNLQRRLGLERAIPEDLEIMIGSQWWCLRRKTVQAIMDFLAQRPDVLRFFRTTWIPDETFFQTLVRHLVPEEEIRPRTLTFLLFSDYGMPVTFYNDHYDMLLNQDYLFARKISPEAHELRDRLGVLYASDRQDFAVSNEGQNLYSFLTGRGREGRRFAARFWETESSLGRDRELMVVVSKKWHVAKRLVEAIRKFTNVPTIDYLFSEEHTELPDLGGIQSTLEKRNRHRRSLMRMLFDHFGTDRLVICLDPSHFDLLTDFGSDRSTMRVLEVESTFTDEYLTGHALRVGLAGENTEAATLERLLPTIRYDIRYESERLRDANFPNFGRVRETSSPAENGAAIAEFLDVPAEIGLQIAETDHLFAD
ncbi:DUF5928 domain-containing protein [Aestuariibius sp. 2305UL40-4]|uniref:DUF5928 domain-containing protein n=1 Tax=Aestuariibius violaceus TaxID=3234132 RepID=UPI00345E1498